MGLSGVSGIRLATRWTHSLRGIVTSGCDLLRPSLPRIHRLAVLMKACTILVLIYLAMTILGTVVRMTKIVVIRGTRVIVYLSGTPPGFSLSARFLAGSSPSGECLKIGSS